jgi:hypothetical protein
MITSEAQPRQEEVVFIHREPTRLPDVLSEGLGSDLGIQSIGELTICRAVMIDSLAIHRHLLPAAI